MRYYPTIEADYSAGLLSWQEYKELKREEIMNTKRKEDTDNFFKLAFGAFLSAF